MGNLPKDRPINAVVQDHKNPHLLFVGTEWGVFVTIDGGRTWRPFRNDMPSVRIMDLVIQPRENDLVVGTYGRGLYIADISPLQGLSQTVLDADVHLFEIEPRTQYVYGGIGNYRLLGDGHLFSPNEPNAIVINYYLKTKTGGEVKITVSDRDGTVLQDIKGAAEAGINTVLWPMRARPAGGQGQRFMGRGGAQVDPGEYVVTLEVGGRKFTEKAVIRGRKGWTVGPVTEIIK
jgi:hypothetical protein